MKKHGAKRRYKGMQRRTKHRPMRTGRRVRTGGRTRRHTRRYRKKGGGFLSGLFGAAKTAVLPAAMITASHKYGKKKKTSLNKLYK